MALIIVLGCLIFLSVIVLTFFTRVRMGLMSSKSYSDNTETRMLADAAVNVVMAQIRQATTESLHAWASQPGMIRTYDNTGNLANAYKLYSSRTMEDSSQPTLQTDLTAEESAMANWSSSPALFTDLNEVASSGAYPILTPPTGTVGGYSISANDVGASTSGGAVPMPVTWLYVLRDGSLIGPDATSTTTATFLNAPTKPSSSNPIVGRIAFWTDDETCKVNINTAGGDGIAVTANGTTNPTAIANATFWSPPYFCAPDDGTLATDQPTAGEFQRYPGHPATVALRNVLNDLGWNNLTSQTFYNQLSGNNIGTPGITPHYAYGGSKGGTVTVSSSAQIPLVPSTGNRLYATVDEMLFRPTSTRTASALNQNNAATEQQIATAHFFLTAHSRAPELNLFGQPRISIWPVWDSTAKSGTTIGNPSPIDQLLSFCATLPTSTGSEAVGLGAPYYFTRKNCADSTIDIALSRNQKLLNYLDYLTSVGIPGFGGNFDAKYSQLGARQILTEIFDYIRTINIADPTQTGSVATSSTSTSNQYSRQFTLGSGGLGRYEVMPSLNTTWGTQGFGIFPRLTEASLQFVAVGSNPSTPSIPSSNIPLNASYNSAILASLNLIGIGDGGSSIALTSPATTPATYSAPAGTTAVQAFLLLHFVIPAQMLITAGPISGANTYAVKPFAWVEVSGLNAFTLNGHALNMPGGVGAPATEAMIWGCTSDGWSAPTWGDMPVNNMLGTVSLGRIIGKSEGVSAPGKYPFYSAIIPITVNASGTGTMTFNGGTITVNLYDSSTTSSISPPTASPPSAAHKIQSYTIIFPGGTFPVPTPSTQFPSGATAGTVTYGATTLTTPLSVGLNVLTSDRWGLTRNLAAPSLSSYSSIAAGDVIESMVLTSTWSDARLLAISAVPSTAFVKHPNWGQQMADSLTVREGAPLLNPTLSATGQLVQGIAATSYGPLNGGYNVFPIVPPTLTGGATSVGAGDWDNGIGEAADGPWINKADEGDLPTNTQLPYFNTGSNAGIAPIGTTFFSPNREVPSPGMFGSLPTGIDPHGVNPKPWQTLLFQPGSTTHPGRGTPASGPPYTTPPDHLLLDLFWMPEVEPYAISDPFSSAGKVNLNYQILPFTYITRSTALRAVLASEKVAEVSGSQAALYKLNSDGGFTGSNGMASNARVALNLDATLAQFDTKFAANDIFRSASQICETYLVPQGYASSAAFATDWYKTGVTGPFALVGDNVRERPYTDIYEKVTTKSNTYQIHYRVQSLQKIKADPNQAQWVEGQDQITGEKRGSVVVERYLDPNATKLPDPASLNPLSTANSLESLYNFRTLNSVTFHP